MLVGSGEVPPVQTDQVSGLFIVPPDQIPLASIVHVLLHPSKLTTFPSSQSSEASLNPSPQLI